MNLHQQLLTNNNCYKAGKKIKPKGIMVHSTGANNPKLSRYVGPDDGNIGTPSSNNWNQPKPGGREVCVHAFIGLDKNNTVRTYQTLPWDYRGWHSGGKANDTHISFEICEDGLKDPKYFKEVYQEAYELCAYLCQKFNLSVDTVIDHSEGHKKGLASNHGDVMHWFPKHGKSMDTFRADVKKRLAEINGQKPSTPSTSTPVTPSVTVKPKPTPTVKTIDQLAQEVIEGKHGSGADRKKSLGSQYQAVQKRVNDILGSPKSNTSKSVATLADEVIKGLHGSGRERMISLGNKYAAVQAEVNRRMK